MNITCSRLVLTDAVSNVSRAVSTKSAIPALEGIKISAYDNQLKISGYDLELGISTEIECKVAMEGEVVLSARLFLEMIKKMQGEFISINCDDKLLCTIQSGVTEYTILGMSSVDFPELPTISDSDNITLKENKLKSMIAQTLFAISTSDTKPVHTGSMFDIAQGKVNIISVDGFRLALRTEKVDTEEEYVFIVPGKTLSEIEKMLSDNDENLEIQVSKKHIIFNLAGYKIVSRLLEGDFLDYKASIPKTSTTSVKIKVKELSQAIERASLLISDRVKSPLRLKFSDNMIKLSCSTSIGKAYDEISCEISGEEIEIGFNSRFLLDSLKASGCDQVMLEINGPLSPMRVTPMEGEDFMFLVLPVRLKAQ